MADTFDILRKLALQVRNATLAGENSAERVGSMFVGILDLIDDLKNIYLHKNQPDETNFLIRFLGGLLSNYIQSVNYSSGALGEGFLIKVDPKTGKSYIEVDELFVRIKAMFTELEIKKLSYAGGNYMFTAAGMKCGKVEEFDTFWRCYLLVDDGETAIENPFRTDDMVTFRDFNIKPGVYENVANRFYWRLCVGVGEDYIDLSKTDCEALNNDIPKEGDSLVQLGNRTDKKRQNAIILSVYGDDAPSFNQYAGIDSYSLAGKEVTVISPNGNRFTGDFVLKTGVNVLTQFQMLEDLIHSEISKVYDDVQTKDNYLFNSAFASNTDGWITTNKVRFFTVNGKFLFFNDNFYSRKDAIAAVVRYDNRNVLRITASSIRQLNDNLANKPIYVDGETAGKFFISFRCKVITAGTLTVGFPDQDLYFTERLEPGKEYVLKEYSGTWNGTGDFELKFTGEIYLYSLALARNALSDLYTELSSKIEQTFESIRLEVSEQSESNNKKFAEIDLRSDSIELSVSRVEKSITELDTSTTQRFSAINQRVDFISASVTSITSDVAGINSSIINLSLRLDGVDGSISAIASRTTTLEQASAGWITTAKGNELWASKTLENGETIVSKINQTASDVTIEAQHIKLEGIVTANSNFKINLDGSIEAKNGRFSGTVNIANEKIILNYDGSGKLASGRISWTANGELKIDSNVILEGFAQAGYMGVAIKVNDNGGYTYYIGERSEYTDSVVVNPIHSTDLFALPGDSSIWMGRTLYVYNISSNITLKIMGASKSIPPGGCGVFLGGERISSSLMKWALISISNGESLLGYTL